MLEQTYPNLLRRFGLLLAAAAILGAASAYYLSRYITPTYESTTSMLVLQPGTAPGNPSDLQASVRVNLMLQQLATTQPVLERAEATGITGMTASEIGRATEVQAVEVFLRITGSGSTPEAAQAVSQVVSDAFIATVNEGLATGPISVTVVEAAGVPRVPVSPNRTMNAAAGGMLGLIAASTLALLYVRLDDVIKDARQVRQVSGLPTLGMLPALDRAVGPEQLRSAQTSGSQFTEAVREVRASLSVVMGVRQDGAFERRVVLITGIRHGDGAGTSAANLALAFGRAGYRTLLVDCNFREPTMHELFEIPGDAGLAPALTRRMDPAPAIQATHYDDVFVLPAGLAKASAVDALGSVEMRDFVEQFSRDYDVVLLAAPPSLEYPDTATLGQLADLVLLVAWSGRTRSKELQQSIEGLERSGGTPVGVVLNGAGRESGRPSGGEGSRQQLPSARLPVEPATPKNPSD